MGRNIIERNIGDEVWRHQHGFAARMRVAAGLIREQMHRASGSGGGFGHVKITDLLLDTMKHAEAGDEAGIEKNLISFCGTGTYARGGRTGTRR